MVWWRPSVGPTGRLALSASGGDTIPRLTARAVGDDRSPDVSAVPEAEADDVNRRYFTAYVTSLPGAGDLRVLDFGCGGGALVRMLRSAGVDCYGADVFYEGADYPGMMLAQLRTRGIVRDIGPDGRIPYDAGSFDVIVSDQVFEHVEDLEAVLDELDRVLKPTGRMYHHFPSREVLREGHIKIPLAHRFRPGPLRTAYTTALRAAGLGSYKADRSVRDWVRWRLDWIDQFCYYRPYAVLRAALDRRYHVRHAEIDYCRFRADGKKLIRWALAVDALRGPYERVFRRLAFMALELRPRVSQR